MTYTIAIISAAAALLGFGFWGARKAQRLCRRPPDGPLTAPDIVTDDIVESTGCAFCDLNLRPQMTSFGFYHLVGAKGEPTCIPCKTDWSHSCQ